MQPFTVRAIEIEDAIASAEYDVIRAKANAYDLLMHRLQGVLWHARNPMQAPADAEAEVQPCEVKADGAEPPPVQAPATEPTPDADPFAAPQPQPDAQGQPQPRRSGRRSRRTEEGQPAPQDAQPAAEPTPDEGQPLTAEALGLTPEPALQSSAQPLPLPVVEAPDVSAAPTSADDVYGTEPAEDPFA